MSDQPNLHDWKPLVEDLGERREKALGMGGPALLERQRSMGKLPVRERLDLLARPRFVRRVRTARRLDGSRARGRRGLPRRRRHGRRRRSDRRAPRRGLRLRLHGDGRLDGTGRRAQDRAAARGRAAPAHPDRLAARLGRGTHPGVVGLDVRRGRTPVPRAGDDERGRAAGRGDARPLRRRHGLHPGARRLHPDGEGHVVDGAGRAASREGGDGRGRDRGGDGRLRGPHEGERRRRPRGGERRGVPRRRARVPVVLPEPQPGAARPCVR